MRMVYWFFLGVFYYLPYLYVNPGLGEGIVMGSGKHFSLLP